MQVSVFGAEQQLLTKPVREDSDEQFGERGLAVCEVRYVAVSYGYVACDSKHIEEVMARLVCSLTVFAGFRAIHLGKDFHLKAGHLDDANLLLRLGAIISPGEYLLVGCALALVKAL